MSLTAFIKRVGCVSPRATVVEASQEMRTRSIGAVVVISDDYKPIGLVTDRDVVMRVVADNKPLNQTSVDQVMSAGVVTLTERASIRAATELMRDKGVRRIVIVDENGRVTGLIAFDDVLLLLGMEIGNLANAVVSEVSREVLEEPVSAPRPQAG
jgi:CBS domain-containing protein